MSLQISNLNSSAIQYNPVIQGSIAQQNEFFSSVNSTREMSFIIDYSVNNNRLYQRADGSIELCEKTIGFVIGEQLAPFVDSVSCMTNNFFCYVEKGFGYLRGVLSSIYNFQVLPGASAEQVHLRAESSICDDSSNSFCTKGYLDFESRFTRGFLPTEDPVYSFPQETTLEDLNKIIGNLSNLVGNKYISQKMEESDWLPSQIESDSLAIRLRAHSMITSIVHAYILENGDLGSSCKAVKIPPKILKSFVSSARSLNRPLTQTYETYILQNWKLIDPNKELSYENIEPLFTYTGLESEKWFIKVHVMSEYYASPAINSSIAIRKLLNGYLEKNDKIDRKTNEEITSHMMIVEKSLIALANNIAKMNEGCEPDEFFHKLRPYLKNHPNGFFIDGESLKTVFPQTMIRSGDIAFAPRGASGAQSSIIPAIDACFGMKVTQQETMSDMLNYMPPEHVELIDWLRDCNIRDYLDKSEDQRLCEAYDAVVSAITKVRKVHYDEIIKKYIVSFIPPELIEKGILGTGETDFTQFLPKNIDDTEFSRCGTNVHDEL